MNCAPILLIGFNRPDFMAAQIAAIKEAEPNRLYIAVDGPRAEKPGEAGLCRQVQDCAKLIDWPCELKTLFHERNLGCKYGVSGAITWFFENETEGIVLEDDCRPTLDFLRFATEMLERYRDDMRIGAVCGFNFFNLQSDRSVSYHFSRHMDVWGWASWRRVWKDYDVEIATKNENVLELINDSQMSSYNKKIYTKFIKDLRHGLSTWDVQLSLLFIDKDYLTIIPRERLVFNSGLADVRASHTNGYVFWHNAWSKAGHISFPVVHPMAILCDTKADTRHDKIFGAIIPRLLTFIGCQAYCLRRFADVVGMVLKKILPSFLGL